MTARRKSGKRSSLHPAGRYKRAPFDWYVEPAWVVEALFESVQITGKIGDPSCGLGTIPEVARARGHAIIAADIIDRGYEHLTTVADFLEDASAFEGCPNIVMNPPYAYRPNIAENMVRRALDLKPEVLAVFVPIRWLASQVRFRLFTDHPPAIVLYFNERPSCPPGHKIADLGNRAFKGASADYCWVVWWPGQAATTILKWIEPREAVAC